MINSQWERIAGRLRDEVGDAAWRSWLRPVVVHSLKDGAVRLALPTRFMRDWVATHYGERLRVLWGAEDPSIRAVDIVVDAAATSAGKTALAKPTLVASSAPAAIAASPAAPEVEELGAQLDPRLTFKNFVVGKPNEFAYAAARRVAEAAQVSFNPLFLYGGVGLGKTHLMHAIAWHIREHDPSRRVLYLSAEKFMYRFIRALRSQDTMSFKEQFRSVDVLMVDDVQFIAGKDATQEEFFHTFNALVDQGRQIVISADKSPSDLEGMEERLKSRLNSGLVADLHATTYELRLGILESKAEQMGVPVPPKVMEFLAHKIASNVRELEGALNRVVAHSQLVGRAITLETTQEVLHDLLRASDRRITIEEIQKRVAEHFNIKLAEMGSARRSRQVARPRQVAMYLAKQLTSRSLPEIGRKFGGRDHTTVMHAVKKVEELKASDQNFSEDVDLLRRMLQG
ncbi:chromosomal replication initiator protein DnaA [Magnetospirillum moscoviense]|uniref:Chromosomal replication initiator protein DnaA n=1 Tax=Magnetospirillum moscoviense TaxID=1437059 RepID=A0A178MA74_9PROT|nr:chromosomal replication initiator protein DnaA [Magnetospirillum moscoviense]MBF0326221.1 chromosomal replication initiator protein DnaA [Alphaproteobacteria bacterium]OAN44945.1 chromosomal replication initiation protein DnaA [Magnetospirillum moscoviense]